MTKPSNHGGAAARPFGPRPLAWALAQLRDLARDFRAWEARRRAHRHLMALSDHHLRDIGLERDNIEAALRRGRNALRGRTW
ncbi:MAG TPA: DUF1127 domain-containing protein [Paracoccaceae bacterium]|nr:DUF1127 domain-containing protein [Paracoccaceae bacterium]